MFGEIYNQSIPKSFKSHGTRWVAHKVKAMEFILNKDGIYIKYLVSLANTDSQALKCLEMEKLKSEKMQFPIAMYFDILTPMKVLSLEFHVVNGKTTIINQCISRQR